MKQLQSVLMLLYPKEIQRGSEKESRLDLGKLANHVKAQLLPQSVCLSLPKLIY